ncbi:MAG: transcription antitermination factor NusB [Firmicutes bacterium]|jgi:N utilization substance protein B|nr:transcription antitermination factor NusB [Bacillota bacterium]
MRRKAREAALQALFQIDVGKAIADQAVAYAIDLNDLDGETEEFCRSLVNGVMVHQDSIDESIERLAVDWSLSRLGNVDRNVLRMALFELMYRQDIPVGVTINEAVEVAKTFGTTDSGRFINGILGQFAREQRLGDTESER